MSKKLKEVFTKVEVQDLIKRIIHQDSFGEVHYEAGKVQNEYGFNFNEDPDEEEPNEEDITDVEFEDEDPEVYVDDDLPY